ncbi:tetratricopeptide repeat protein [Methanothrix harundinacea]|jgi:tetratricopeptide (TPR) repeat protein|uniref:Protein NO VEIN C-terminal domain-containing protein n=1 Tax=Methanothrix harundinacea (strain 6Ac) TaxID=1110509 RepID=G7WPL0_METH6|nr:tetratricopeptide repeat protein [Methanothrix harundinacea]AET65211.1 hypothetical protein Mhar_1854 [Methanothrix harundinacea 6Ac]
MKYEYENAIQYFDEAINRHRKSIMALIGKAFCLFDLKKYEESDKYYDMVLVIDPNHASALVGKGKIFYEKRDLNKAIEYFTKASNSDPKFMVPLLNKIYVFQELGEHDRANACYNNIRKSDKKFYLLSKIVDGIELCENDRFEDAIDIYSEIVQKDPNLISAWINMGLIYYLLGIYEKSNACCNRAIAIDPKSTMALYCKRVIYYKQNEFNKSNEYYQRVLEIDPNFFSLNWISDTVYVKHNKAVEYFTFFGTYNKNIIIKIINSTASSDAQLLRLQQSDDRDQHSISDSNLDTIEESLLKFAGQRIDQRVYFEKNICNMDLEFKIGNLGEKYVNNYLTQLERNGSIKRFCWVSDQHATSPFDFYVINDNLDVILIDIKSTNNHFNNKFYLSSNELEQIASSEYEYRIYRIYEMSDSTAKLRISEDIRDFIKSVFELLNRLPEGVRPENISISPSVLTFQSEIIIERGW